MMEQGDSMVMTGMTLYMQMANDERTVCLVEPNISPGMDSNQSLQCREKLVQ